jgi:tetratricopeptide (TPR) repeat protein
MDKEKVLKEIQSNIRAGKTDLASIQIVELANNFSGDPYTMLTCASLLKVIEDESGAKRIAKTIVGKIEDKDRLEVAKGLRGIGFSAEAEELLSHAADGEDVFRARMLVYFDLGKHVDCVNSYRLLSAPTLADTAVMIDSLSASGGHDDAVGKAKELLAEAPDSLAVQRCYCSALISAGMSKEAGKYVKDNLKKNKGSSDADALASYFLWVEGKGTSAGAYASKAIKADPDNTMAMEILAYCLVEKEKLQEAKIVAGAINEKEPGNPAVVRILAMCKK